MWLLECERCPEYENAHDVLIIESYRVRYESSGPVLIRHGRAISISPSELQMLDRVNGNYTLQQIREELGDQALYLIGGLYKQCFIALQ
jgi:hypothetical protein